MTIPDTPRTDSDLIKESKLLKLTKQNYHGLAKSKKVWYETMAKTRDIYEEGENSTTATPRTDAYLHLPSGTEGERALIRELILLRSDALEYQTHERDSNYRWEKIRYGTGQTEINWSYWTFRLAYQPLTPCKAI